MVLLRKTVSLYQHCSCYDNGAGAIDVLAVMELLVVSLKFHLIMNGNRVSVCKAYLQAALSSL